MEALITAERLAKLVRALLDLDSAFGTEEDCGCGALSEGFCGFHKALRVHASIIAYARKHRHKWTA